MPGRLGVDFGTSNTVISLWDTVKQDSRTLQLGNYSRTQEATDGSVFTIPSLIHYAEDGNFLYGEEVLQKNVLEHASCGTSPVTCVDKLYGTNAEGSSKKVRSKDFKIVDGK
jgi:molecular chaperone DnaK (HSP70)